MIGEVAGSTLLAIVVTKLVDLVRKLDKQQKQPKGLWIALAMAIGVAIALFYEVNVLAELGLDPSSRLQGIFGQVLTGLLVGAFGSGWHEVFDALSSLAKMGRAGAIRPDLSMEDLRRIWGANPPPSRAAEDAGEAAVDAAVPVPRP
jgi:uncharacterized membrane protein YdcZ (DUF606 family)